MFLPTDVCQTGILWEAALRKISLLISRLIDFFSPSKIVMHAACAGNRRRRRWNSAEANEGEKQRWKGIRP